MILGWIKHSFFAEHNNWVLWIPVLFGLGVIFYFSFSSASYFFPFCLFLLALFLIFGFKDQPFRLLVIALTIFLMGFLWTNIYTEIISYNSVIRHTFYATVVGQIDDVREFYNPILKRKSYKIVLADIVLYKAGIIDGDVLIRKNSVKQLKKQKEKKLRKKQNKTIIKTYLNVAGYQDIDREFLAVDYEAQNQYWLGGKYIDPPEKISISVNTRLNGAKIGDVVQSRVILKPSRKPSALLGGYDAEFVNYFKGIGGTGYAASDIKILQDRKYSEGFFGRRIKTLRQDIAQNILQQTDKNYGGVAVALLVGLRDFVPKEIMNNVRNSGLAHLLAISGLHFALAAGIFFFSIRFLLSCNQYLVLNFNIKKIAAFVAIFVGLGYLLLVGNPIPALRAFIVISLIFLAILLDLQPNSFRILAFAALMILIFSPYVILSVSFQLSFAAVLALIVLADYGKKFHINSSERPFYLKFCFYFIGIILTSLVASLATMPFSIYYFNSFVPYGVLANLFAIPIVSFVTMPCGFLALLLMPFGLEWLFLVPMQISIGWIIDIANFVVLIPNSYLAVKTISIGSFAMIICGGLWFCLWQKRWRFLGLIVIIMGTYLAYKTPIPNLLVDQEKKMVAFVFNKKLVFVKKTKSKQAKIWAKKLGLVDIVSVDELNDKQKKELELKCTKEFCQFVLDEEKILVLKGRNKVEEICSLDYDLVINVDRKYQLPKCFDSNPSLKT